MEPTQQFSEVAALWKAEKSHYIKKSSYAIYLVHLNRHLIPWFGSGGVPSQEHVQAFVNNQLASGLSVVFIRNSLLVLKMVLKYGESIGVWQNKTFKIKFPTGTEHKKNVQVLTREQQKILVRHLSNNFSFRNIGIYICLQCGLRIGEVCALQWQDIDMVNSEIHITKTIQRISISDGDRREYLLQMSTPKTPSSVRDIPITHEMMRLIKPLKKLMRDDYYVVSNTAKPLEPRYLRDYFTKLMSQLGLPTVHFHCLRHSFATRCIEGKCDYKTVSAILGHSSLATTMDLYVHPGHDEKKRCIEQMSRALSR